MRSVCKRKNIHLRGRVFGTKPGERDVPSKATCNPTSRARIKREAGNGAGAITTSTIRAEYIAGGDGEERGKGEEVNGYSDIISFALFQFFFYKPLKGMVTEDGGYAEERGRRGRGRERKIGGRERGRERREGKIEEGREYRMGRMEVGKKEEGV